MLTNTDHHHQQEPALPATSSLAHHHRHHQHSEEELFQKNSSLNLQAKLSAAESQDSGVLPSLKAWESSKPHHPVIFGLSSLALIITLGDSIHNLLDGVAIGIAFSNSIASGISTAIAVLFHELPHEFGDFAVLLSTGLSVRRAAVVNLLAALTAFIGLYVGLLLGANEAANRWALAICAGLFLYVALVDMVSGHIWAYAYLYVYLSEMPNVFQLPITSYPSLRRCPQRRAAAQPGSPPCW